MEAILIGNNSAGGNNEINILNSLNQKTYSQLNQNFKLFIKDLYPSISDNDIITCNHIAGKNKRDIEVIVNNISYGISIKMGSGNSIHQEKIECFIKLLENDYNISSSLANALRLFIWGDGSLDGTGNATDRISSKDCSKVYHNEIKLIQDFFDHNREKLIYRFLVSGAYNDVVDYIYYGTEEKSIWCKSSNAIEYLKMLPNSNSVISLGNISFQAWNRSITGNSDKKRGEIQLKWASIEKDILNIRRFYEQGNN